MGTKDFGKIYTTSIELPDRPWPPAARALTLETGHPWRIGRGFAIRPSALAALIIGLVAWGASAAISWRDPRALVVGYWSKPPFPREPTSPDLERLRLVDRLRGGRIYKW